ncbi:hypothetical protein BVY01_01285 [bacterium I07]|nr:hypothetical protein BVY01_01285 [bacterium I07]
MTGWDTRGFRDEYGYDASVPIRDFLGYHPKATLSEHNRLKDLLLAANRRLKEAEKQMCLLEQSHRDKKETSGSWERAITSSFRALFFWMSELEAQLSTYSRKVHVETEFGPRVGVLRRRIKILVKRDASLNN